MDYITPQNTIIFSLFLIGLSLTYKWIERRLFQAMHKDPAAFQNVGRGFRYRYQQLYREQADERHIGFFDDDVTKKRLQKVSHFHHSKK